MAVMWLTVALCVPVQYTAYTIHCTKGRDQWRTKKRFSDVSHFSREP